MKKFFTLLLCVLSFFAKAQWSFFNMINFDSGDVFYTIAVNIDTAHYHHNIWQIGTPNKVVFRSAYSVPHAVVTDTFNSYPPNDTSVFILKIPGYTFFPFTALSFYYQLDIDSTASANVEISIDTGQTWINLLDSLPASFSWSGGIVPNLHNSTTGWTQFALFSGGILSFPDSILFRFTFRSGSVLAHKDGWIIDDIFVEYIREQATKMDNSSLISLYPNPSRGTIFIRDSKQHANDPEVTIYSTLGQEIYQAGKLHPGGKLELPLPNGTYILKYQGGDGYCVARIVIDR